MNRELLKQTFVARKNWLLLIFLLLIADIAGFVYASVFQEPRIESLQTNWFEKRRQSSRVNVVDAATVYTQGTKDLQVWESRIPPKKEFARVLGELYEVAGNSSLVVSAVTYKPTTIKDEGLLAYTFDFSVTGRYAGIKSFLSDLQRSRQLFIVDDIAISNQSQTKEDVVLKIKLTTYFRMEGK